MQWILAFHIIFMVAWFAGLFYLPRLFVYHCASHDSMSIERFKTMEYKLFYMIMTPAAIMTSLLGLYLLIDHWSIYKVQGWMHAKLTCVILLWAYHIHAGYLLHTFRQNRNRHSALFYRYYNEIPTVLLIAIVILVIVKP